MLSTRLNGPAIHRNKSPSAIHIFFSEQYWLIEEHYQVSTSAHDDIVMAVCVFPQFYIIPCVIVIYALE